MIPVNKTEFYNLYYPEDIRDIDALEDANVFRKSSSKRKVRLLANSWDIEDANKWANTFKDKDFISWVGDRNSVKF